MSAGEQGTGRELARGLSEILTHALTAPGAARTLEAARDLAKLLALPGLDRMLGTLMTYGGFPWPVTIRPAADRLLAAAADAARDGTVDVFRRADHDLGLTALAIESAALRGSSRPAYAASAATSGSGAPVRLSEVLAGLAVQRGADLLPRVHLEPLVAAAYRAALDWLLDDGAVRRPLALESDGSALETRCEGIQFAGLEPAAEVLAGVGAHLGPSGEPGVWSLRVPLASARATYLMIGQDQLALAVPWPAVVRVRLLPADAIDAMAQRQGFPVLPPLARDPRRATEQPVVIVALGLKRACVVADRLVWRMAADALADPGDPPVAVLRRAVRSDDGEIYWVLDPAWLLRDVAPPPLPEARRRPAAPVAPPPAPAPPPLPFHRPAGALRELGQGDVEPIEPETGPAAPHAAAPHVATPAEAPPALPTPADIAIPASPARPAPPEADVATATPATPARPQALIAEDSLTARVFLTRLLEQRGFDVHAVSSARDLLALLRHGPWALVCADTDLPDARGAEALAEARRVLGPGATVVALVRDREDEALARSAGVDRTLRKPFEHEALDALLDRRPAAGGPGDGPR